MQSVVRVDSNQMRIERSVMKFREWYPIRHRGLTKLFMLVLDYMRSIQQYRFWDARNGTPATVRRNDGLSEGCLMQPLLDCTQRIPAFQCILRWRQNHLVRRTKYDRGLKRCGVPVRNEDRQYGLIGAGSNAQEVDHRYGVLVRFPRPAVI